MAIIINPPATQNMNLALIATTLRDTFQRIDQLSQWMSNLAIADIETAYGVSAADAATIQSSVGNMEALSKIYQGAAQSGGAFNYMLNSSAVWGGN